MKGSGGASKVMRQFSCSSKVLSFHLRRHTSVFTKFGSPSDARGVTFEKCYDWSKETHRRMSRVKHLILWLTPFCYDLTNIPVGEMPRHAECNQKPYATADYDTASFQKFSLENGPSPWDIWTFKGHFEATISNGAGIRDPQFEIVQIESMRTSGGITCLTLLV